ncbi:MAG: response regulator, partial [Lentisphaerae bacterium]|nr:response regulator [Lentisphaerota bacterium]
IELHGGKLLIDSPVPGTDHGTQVSVVLSLTPSPRVLVAVDERSLLDQVCLVCSRQGYPVSSLRTAHDLLQECRVNPPDVLILDESLPDAAGLDLVLQLRNDRRTARLPMIMLGGGTLARPQNDMLIAFQIPLLPKPLKDQALAGALNVIFYDRTLLANRSGGNPAPSTIIAP